MTSEWKGATRWTSPRNTICIWYDKDAQEVEDVTALSKSQRQNADMQHDNATSQHANAHKLEVIGAALDATANGLKDELKKL